MKSEEVIDFCIILAMVIGFISALINLLWAMVKEANTEMYLEWFFLLHYHTHAFLLEW